MRWFMYRPGFLRQSLCGVLSLSLFVTSLGSIPHVASAQDDETMTCQEMLDFDLSESLNEAVAVFEEERTKYPVEVPEVLAHPYFEEPFACIDAKGDIAQMVIDLP